MNKEDKSLLLKDLCARLPYKVIIKSVGENKIIGLWDLRDIDNLPLPYLRPMSNMTEEELREFKALEKHCESLPSFAYISVSSCILFDWLNEHHFDYRGLIEEGLAIEATEDMYGKSEL